MKIRNDGYCMRYCITMQQKNLESSFFVGQSYKNLDEVQKALNAYNKVKSTDFRITANNKRSVLVKCKHGSKAKENVNSNSPNGNSNVSLLGCYANITFNKSQRAGDDTLKLAKTNLSHNHLVRKEWENLENMKIMGKDKEMFLKLRRANAQLSQINNVLTERKNKKNTTTEKSKKLVTYNVPNTTTNNYDKISLDALQEFLGNLMDESGDESGKNKNLSEKDKYKIVMPVLNRIGRLITHQPTKQFLGYLEDLSKLETSIHLGQRDIKKVPPLRVKDTGIMIKEIPILAKDMGIIKKDITTLGKDIIKKEIPTLGKDMGIMIKEIPILAKDMGIMKKEISTLGKDMGIIPTLAKDFGVMRKEIPIVKGEPMKQTEIPEEIDDDPKSSSSDIHVTMKKRTDVEIHHRRDMQSNDISTIDINNFQSSDVSTIELNLRIPSFFSM